MHSSRSAALPFPQRRVSRLRLSLLPSHRMPCPRLKPLSLIGVRMFPGSVQGCGKPAPPMTLRSGILRYAVPPRAICTVRSSQCGTRKIFQRITLL